MRRIISLLLVVCMLISGLSGVVFAIEEDAGEGQGGVGASYNQETGEADIVTGKNKGDIKNYVKPEDWELAGQNGTLTPTLYRLKVNGQLYKIGMFYDVDWSNAVSEYKNSKEEIEGFVRAVVDSPDGKRDKLTESGIWDKGFEVHINAMVYVRKPNETTFDLYNIEEDYNLLMYNKISGTGPRTWIANVVERAAKNLGSMENGWAYYKVPAPNPKPQVVPEDVSYVVETYVKIVGVNPDGSLKYRETKPAEVKETELDERGLLKIEEIKEIEEGTAYLNDIIVSRKNLLDSDSDIIWVEELPKSSKDKIEPTSQDISKYLLGEITGVMNYILDYAEVSEEITNGGGQTLLRIEKLRAMSDDLKAGKTVSIEKLQKAFMQIREEYTLGNLNLEQASPEFKQALVGMSLDKAVKAYNSSNVGLKSTSAETFYEEAILIKNLSEVYLDNTHPNETTEVEIEIAQPKSSNSNEDIVVIEKEPNSCHNFKPTLQ